jgi:DNA (cytosine-5)-methyltransferase 1
VKAVRVSRLPERRAIELCAGLGGIGIGLRALGFAVVKAYDSWGEAVAIYNHNFPDGCASQCNLVSAGGFAAVRRECREFEDIDLLAAGPPCKGFSQLRNGYHDGRNGHNRLMAAMPAYVALLKPRLFLVENVPDLMRHRQGRTFAAVLDAFRHPAGSLRYRVEHQIYDAAAFGTPQARRRLLILGVRDGAGKEHLPAPGADLAPLFAALRHGGRIPSHLIQYVDRLADPDDDQYVTAAQALSDLPLLGAGEAGERRKYATKPQSAYQRWCRKGAPDMLNDTRTPGVNARTVSRLRHIPPGGCARDIPEVHLDGLSRRYDSAYRRLHPDVPSTALSTKYDCVYHYAKARSLSVREYARVQGIPDRISFPASYACRRSAYEMIGNSVPPRLIERVMAEVAGLPRAESSRPQIRRAKVR